MKIAIIERENQIAIHDRPVPKPMPEQILLRISRCGICGSDLAAFNGSGHKALPYSPGHEFCGTVDRIGGQVTGFQPGDRGVVDPNLGCGECLYCRMGRPNLCDFLKTRLVKSNGGFAEFAAIDASMAHHLPDDLSDDAAVLVEPLSCAVHAAELADSVVGGEIAVFGAGILGILTALALTTKGVNPIVVEPAASRRAQASVIPGVRAMTPAELNDAGITLAAAVDCSGNAKALTQMISRLGKAGTLVLAGLVMNDGLPAASLREITQKELLVKGAWLNPNSFPAAIETVSRHRATLTQLKTADFALGDIAAAFSVVANPEYHKIIVRIS